MTDDHYLDGVFRDAFQRSRDKIIPLTLGQPGEVIGHVTNVTEDDDGIHVDVKKFGAYVQISQEMLNGYSLGFDKTPPPLTRRQRLRAWLRRTTWDARVRLASWIVGFGVTDRDEDY